MSIPPASDATTASDSWNEHEFPLIMSCGHRSNSRCIPTNSIHHLTYYGYLPFRCLPCDAGSFPSRASRVRATMRARAHSELDFNYVHGDPPYDPNIWREMFSRSMLDYRYDLQPFRRRWNEQYDKSSSEESDAESMDREDARPPHLATNGQQALQYIMDDRIRLPGLVIERTHLHRMSSWAPGQRQLQAQIEANDELTSMIETRRDASRRRIPELAPEFSAIQESINDGARQAAAVANRVIAERVSSSPRTGIPVRWTVADIPSIAAALRATTTSARAA